MLNKIKDQLLKNRIKKRMESNPSLVVFEIYLTNLLNQYGDFTSLLFGNLKNIVRIREYENHDNDACQLELNKLVNDLRSKTNRPNKNPQHEKELFSILDNYPLEDMGDTMVRYNPSYSDINIRQWYYSGKDWREIHSIQPGVLLMIDDMISPGNQVKTEPLNTLFLKKRAVTIERFILDDYTWKIKITPEVTQKNSIYVT